MPSPNVTVDKEAVLTSNNEPLYEPHPRVIPFAVRSADEYEVECHAAAGVAVFIETNDKGQLGMVALSCGPGGCGLFLGMKASDLREFGASLVRAADRIDDGRGKQ